MKFHISSNRIIFFGNQKEEEEKKIPSSSRGNYIYTYIYIFILFSVTFDGLIHVSNWSLRWQYGVIMINLFPSVIRHGFEFAWEIKYA